MSTEPRRIAQFLTDLKSAGWLGTARRWWPDYLFHFTDIQNAVSILKSEALFSRIEAQRRGLMGNDNASQEVLGGTDVEWMDYVRLYFRPHTPTQANNEGFRPERQRLQGAHCPVPTYFLFDSRLVLSRIDSQFTDGNLASRGASVFSNSSDLASLPFRRICHDKAEWNNRQIVFNQNAEVIVPKQLGLEALKYIVCRSQAEYETLLHLLPQSTLRRWERNIIKDNQTRLFFKRWAYVQSVELSSSRIVFNFNDFPQHAGPFQIYSSITDTVSDKQFVWADSSFSADGVLPFDLTDIGPLSDYSVRLTLDKNIAYAYRYQEYDLPW